MRLPSLPKLLIPAVVIVAAAFFTWPSAARQQPAPPPPPEKRDALTEAAAMYQAQERLARRALGIIDQSAFRGAPVNNNPAFTVYLWSRRLLEAQIYLSLPRSPSTMASPDVYLSLPNVPPSPERLTAFRDHWDRMKRWESKSRPLFDSGTMSTLDFLDVQNRRVEAEAWFYREQARNDAAQPPPPPRPEGEAKKS